MVAAGVPVPRPLCARARRADASETAGYLMDHVDGTSVAPRVLRRDATAVRPPAPSGPACGGARPHPLDRRPGFRRRRTRPATRRSPRVSSGRRARQDRRAAAGRGGRACAGCGSTRRPHRRASLSSTATFDSATSSSTSRASPRSSTGSSATRGTRPRTSAGSASARGGSATTIARWRVWVRSTSSWTPTRPPAAAARDPERSAVVGGDGQRQVGGRSAPARRTTT